ncbi:hypothetical protein AY600_20070 [Phormidium willei BDU 130791]|nr:hypothetical protein AY600_20070 [Phormidium willei BDU 130791]
MALGEGTVPIDILVVDDDPEILLELSDLLRGRGLSVAAARSLADAEACLEAYRPAVVLVDLALGQDSGLALVERVQVRSAGTRSVLMSGNLSALRQFGSRMPDELFVIEKPVPVDFLVRFLRNLFGDSGISDSSGR